MSIAETEEVPHNWIPYDFYCSCWLIIFIWCFQVSLLSRCIPRYLTPSLRYHKKFLGILSWEGYIALVLSILIFHFSNYGFNRLIFLEICRGSVSVLIMAMVLAKFTILFFSTLLSKVYNIYNKGPRTLSCYKNTHLIMFFQWVQIRLWFSL